MEGPKTGALLAERYRLGPPLGEGGMGAVFRARDELLGDDVALKVLLAAEPGAMERVRDEVRLARRVTHRNVARTFDLGIHEGSPFVTMELLEGTSFRELLRRAVGPDKVIVGMLAQIADGLGTAHRADVVHRDLKPSNVVVVAPRGDAPAGEEPRAVLIDFGVSMAAGQGAPGVSGTWDYMSPEQLRGDPASAPSDVFALGVLIFHALSGRLPYPGASPEERALARVQMRPDLRALFAAPIALGDIVQACLAAAPEDRPAANEVAGTLREWLACATVISTPSLRTPTLDSGDATTAFLSMHAPGSAAKEKTPSRKEPVLGVAPLEPIGTGLARSLAAGVSTHLSDRLSRARGVLLASGAFLETIESGRRREAARAAGLDLLIEGTLEVNAATEARVEIRLVDLRSDAVVLDRRLSCPMEGLLDLGADLAGRVAEAMRIELEVATSAQAVPQRVIELYLQARHELRRPELGLSRIAAQFDACLALAPDFVPAKVSRALALARVYSFANLRASAEEEVEAAILEAEGIAPDAADTNAARGSFELQRGHLRSAITCFRRALEIAPTHPFALEQLGRVACEAGRTREGIELLELATTLDPLAQTSLCLVARSFALRGRLEEYRAVMRRLPDARLLEVARLELRVADWYGDVAVAERFLREWPDARPPDPASVVVSVAAMMAGRADGTARFEEMEQAVFGRPLGGRFRAVLLQGAVEMRGRRDPARALALLEECVALPFFDIEWLELCPALDGLREEPRFIAAQRAVRARVAAVWDDVTGSALRMVSVSERHPP